jgi:hypothetical protein
MEALGRVVMSDPIRATTRSIQELRNWIIINGQFGPHGTELLECLMHIDELRASRPSASHLEQTTLGIAGTLPPSDQEIEEWADQSDLIPSEELVCDEQWQRCFLPKQFYATIRAALARWGSLAALAVPPPAAAPPPAPVAWCNSDDFLVAAEKRQSFSGWRERHYDCDMALYAAPPPAPAASTPLDLDALLGPEGAYERGTGHEDGAQLVSSPHGLEWWAPLYGCDTLDNLLDQLRARILPHLRPPVAGIDVPGVDGDYGGLQELCDAEGVDPRVGVPLLRRARQAWKVAAQPPAPTPAPASDEEREKLASWLENHAAHLRKMESIGALGETELTPALERIATLLRQPAPAAVPVAVAERLPQFEDCRFNPGAVIGSCWCWNPHSAGGIGWWSFEPLDWAEDATHWLPAHAIPTPQPPQGGEVAQ